MVRAIAAVVIGLLAAALAARAGEPVGQSLALPETGPHWIWVGDALLRRAALVDGDTGRFFGQVPGGTGIIAPILSHDGRELYLAETHYSRTTRGTRTDLVSIADARTLAPLGEVVIPPKRSEHTSWIAGSALSDDGRFLAVFNLNPATSLSIVDTTERRFVGEIETPGCSLVYPAGPRRFFSLCADGTALVVTLDETGAVAAKAKSERFFDPLADPVLEKGVRRGSEWIFVSFAGQVHALDVSGAALRFAEPWAMVAAGSAERGWRVGGMQPLALHGASGQLYALMHEGGEDSHKQPGTEVWAFDLTTHERLRRMPLRSPAAAFVLEQAKQEPGGALDWLLQRTLPNEGLERIAVTQDAAPLLFTATGYPSTLAVYDAATGTHLRDVHEIGIASALLQLP